MAEFIYHFKPKRMAGQKLLPLNTLKTFYPEIYTEHVKKYLGREKLLSRRIPILECLWNDVLHFSPINPQLILDIWHTEKMKKPEAFEVYKIPAELFEEKTTICFQSFNFDYHNFNPELEKFWNFQYSQYKEQLQVSDEQIDVWREDIKGGRPTFWFSHTMHILAKQEIDTQNLEIIVCE